MSNSTGSGSQTQWQSPPTIPKWLKPYYKNTASQLEAAQGNLPNITDLYGSVPLLNVMGPTGNELSDISQFQNIAQNPNNPLENAAAYGYSNFLGGPGGGPSAATQAALQQFNTLQAPSILSNAALMGQGNSGAALTALTQGQESALVPFMQQDLQNQLSASQGLASLGGQEASQQQTDLSNALQAAGLPREIADQQAQALFNQQQQQWQFASGIQTGGQAQFPSLLGGGTGTTNFNSAAPKF